MRLHSSDWSPSSSKQIEHSLPNSADESPVSSNCISWHVTVDDIVVVCWVSLKSRHNFSHELRSGCDTPPIFSFGPDEKRPKKSRGAKKQRRRTSGVASACFATSSPTLLARAARCRTVTVWDVPWPFSGASRRLEPSRRVLVACAINGARSALACDPGPRPCQNVANGQRWSPSSAMAAPPDRTWAVDAQTMQKASKWHAFAAQTICF
jgi:hypothetical protein